ncbi:hypothetical protein KP509_04G016900 [Ceratopteris richardii]|nr:hypothetical protein KP509_04G016900 [Ceratopteris richardii]
MGHEVNHGKLPNSVMPEVLDEKNIAAVHAECGMNDTEVSPLVSAENAETQGRAGNKVSVMVYGVNALGCSEGQKSSETVLPESSLQIPREGGATSPSSDTVTPENDLKPSELPEPDVGDLNHNEQGALTHEVKPNVQLGFQRKHGDININGMAKTDADVLVGTDVKLNKHSEDGRALEEKVKHEMVSANSIQEVNIYGNDNILKSEGEDNNSGYSAQMSEGAKKDIDMKLVDDSFPSDVQTKRGNEFKVQEPAKRMRRWNAGNHATADTLKPVTSGSVEDIVLPENKNGSCSPSPKPTAKGEMAPRLLPGISDSSSGLPKRTTPKVVATTRSLPPLVKVESCESKRIVPPSKRTPSNTLKVDGFVRPFTLKSLQDTLASFGKFSYFWMDDIKTHCYVSYPSVNDAVAARNWLFGRQWPPIVGNFLSADFVDPNELKIRIEGLSEKPQAGSALALTRVPDPMPAPSRPDHSQSFPTNSTASSMSLPPLEQRLCPPPEPPMPTLEDLFLKTKAKPHIYYLPLTDEQVAERLKNK